MIALILLAVFIAISLSYVVWYKLLKARALKKINHLRPADPEKWSTSFLEEKRKHTDPLADNVVNTIIVKGELTSVNHLFGLFVNDGDKLPTDAPPEIKDYFAQTARLPDWADQDLIALGQQIYIRHGVWISLLLSYKALPECYACAKGAEVLFHTARLNEHHGSLNAYARRIAETAQFVFYSLSPKGLSIKGRGLRATQKVRLIHAIIRHYLKQKNWDSSKFGEPINQQDMAGTLMSFSALVLEGMEQLGIRLERVEREAYMHTWRVVGHIVGLNDDLIPENADDGLRLGHTILDHQLAESDHSKELMKSLLDFQDSISKPFFSAQGNIEMMRLMMGDKISNLLAVPAADPKKMKKLGRKIKIIASIAEFLDHSLIFAMAIQFISKIGLQLMINKMTPTKTINFYLPKSMTQDWRVSKN